MRAFLVAFLVATLTAPGVYAQVTAQGNVWRTFAERIEVGTRIRVRLTDGERVSATLVQAAPEGLLLQPLTRVPVPVQQVPYDSIVSIERDDARGIAAGKAVAIGVACGVATFLGLLFIIAAAFD